MVTTAALPRPRLRWSVTVSTIVLHLLALLALLPGNFSWGAVGVAFGLHALTQGLGISLGFHRLASHRSLRAPLWLEHLFILLGTLAFQGGVYGWVGYHRLHHLHTDQELDPHSASKGFWWSHINWLMHTVPTHALLPRMTKDIREDRFYQFCHNQYIPLQVGLGVLLYLAGGMPFVVWGVFVRLLVSFHGTCFVNSACHQFGYRPTDTDDMSTNCWWVAVLTYGEGWHNNHHACQSSACFQQNWWEIDPVWQVIRLLRTVGLVTKVKTAQSS